MSATQTPPEQSGAPAPPPERHCRRCGASLGADQDWCLACGAAANTEVARPRGWRLALILAGAVVALAIAAAILAIAELSGGSARVAEAPTATPTATVIPSPSVSPTSSAPENEGDQPTPGATATATPPPAGGATAPGATVTAAPSATPSASPTSSFPDWPAGRSAWTIVLKSATSRSAAESAAGDLQSQGVTVGILHSDDHSSLNPGYWVVFSGQYDSQKAAQNGLSSLPSKPADAYVRRVSAT